MCKADKINKRIRIRKYTIRIEEIVGKQEEECHFPRGEYTILKGCNLWNVGRCSWDIINLN